MKSKQDPQQVAKQDSRSEGRDFARDAAAGQAGFLTEFWLFLRDNKKWWLTPVIVVLLLLGALVVLGGTPVAPFVYTLF